MLCYVVLCHVMLYFIIYSILYCTKLQTRIPQPHSLSPTPLRPRFLIISESLFLRHHYSVTSIPPWRTAFPNPDADHNHRQSAQSRAHPSGPSLWVIFGFHSPSLGQSTTATLRSLSLPSEWFMHQPTVLLPLKMPLLHTLRHIRASDMS